MLIAAVIVGGLTAYYFGLRRGAYAAVATAVLCLIAMFVPGTGWPIYGALALACVAIWQLGKRRARPTDAVLATRWVRRQVRRVVGGGDSDDRGDRPN
jgi:hypothetical protein